MPAPAEGPAQGGAAEAIYDRGWGRMASLATGDAGEVPTLRLAAGLSAGNRPTPSSLSFSAIAGGWRWPTLGAPAAFPRDGAPVRPRIDGWLAGTDGLLLWQTPGRASRPWVEIVPPSTGARRKVHVASSGEALLSALIQTMRESGSAEP
jgi:hypothetical protein